MNGYGCLEGSWAGEGLREAPTEGERTIQLKRKYEEQEGKQGARVDMRREGMSRETEEMVRREGEEK